MMQFDLASETVLAVIDSGCFITSDLYLFELWLIRTQFGQRDAKSSIAQMHTIHSLTADAPLWSKAWISVTHAQIEDLEILPVTAFALYRETLPLTKRYRSEHIDRVVSAGLLNQFGTELFSSEQPLSKHLLNVAFITQGILLDD
jgi:hypothetical protein